MDDPPAEIASIIHRLTQSPPSLQRQTIETYFTPNASFTHPFCRTGSFEGSRWLIWCIYRWYKIMSPRIELTVESVAYDSQNLILYVTIAQVFAIFFLPFYRVHGRLTTVLHLVQLPPPPPSQPAFASGKSKFYIRSQNDLYQVNQFVKFVSPLGVASVVLLVVQLLATAACVLGAGLGWPVSWVEENVLGKGKRWGVGEGVKGVRDVVVG